MGFPKKCVEEFGTFVHLERYSKLQKVLIKVTTLIKDPYIHLDEN